MITFAKITSYSRGTLARLLRDAYSFDPRWNAHYGNSFDEFDRFFYDNPNIADNCGFITLCEGEPIGHISWDPRGTPEVVRLGHNCIATRYKRRGYGRAQLLEALRLITERCHPKQNSRHHLRESDRGKAQLRRRRFYTVGYTQKPRG